MGGHAGKRRERTTSDPEAETNVYYNPTAGEVVPFPYPEVW